YKNKEIGFTVKDLTYEVRAALRLSDDKAAVVVSKVEPGSPVQVAKINPFELITELDREAVSSVEEFEKRIEEALKAGKQTVRLKVEYLGKSRLADLDLSEVEATESD
ncbi:MAG: PDZ domain-containing protein, partial [Planctomycetota bacterium]